MSFKILKYLFKGICKVSSEKYHLGLVEFPDFQFSKCFYCTEAFVKPSRVQDLGNSWKPQQKLEEIFLQTSMPLDLFAQQENFVLCDFCFLGREECCIFTPLIRNYNPLYWRKLVHKKKNVMYFFFFWEKNMLQQSWLNEKSKQRWSLLQNSLFGLNAILPSS